MKRQAEQNDDPPPLDDDVVEDGPGGDEQWKEDLLDFVNSKLFAGTMMLFTFYALFADDIRLASTEKPEDDIFFGLSTVALGLFTLELVLNVVAKRG